MAEEDIAEATTVEKLWLDLLIADNLRKLERFKGVNPFIGKEGGGIIRFPTFNDDGECND